MVDRFFIDRGILLYVKVSWCMMVGGRSSDGTVGNMLSVLTNKLPSLLNGQAKIIQVNNNAKLFI